MTPDLDHHFMKHALSLAARGLGIVAPNPAVGCVIVRYDEHPMGVVVGRGYTQAGGRPHAETEALEMAGAAAAGATVYVSLEPCAHQGKTPPCAEALIRANVDRLVIACLDPDPRTSGQGAESIKEFGIDVCVGIMEDEARQLNRGFFFSIEKGRPMVSVKVATSLDGRIATHSGDSQWITSGAARRRGHMMRAQSDAIMIGSTTAILDDPSLDCRLEGLEDRSPIRIVCDGRMRLPLTSKICQTAKERPSILVTLNGADALRRKAFQECGLDVITVPANKIGQLDLGRALEALADRGLTRVLVEGGGHLIASLMNDRLVDEIHWFRAPKIIGGDGIAAVQAFGVNTVEDAAMFERQDIQLLGEDLVETYAIRH
jgi:diaminohydroxyphosphoribosylaminopyrimidine deaminase / 5-amino-6-(5-phosphoribosylamino)uracil reductase